MQQRHRIAIALGSNQGDRARFLQLAYHRLCEDLLENPLASSVYETSAWGGVAQGDFLNAVVTGESDWKPPAIVSYLKELERELGRTVTQNLGNREIDLDLLAHDSTTCSQVGVEVPHPRMQDRSFVLVPFAEVWPEWVHPRLGKTAKAMMAAVVDTQQKVSQTSVRLNSAS
jgi:2-amino-4-hydroxy-6-hydroxymethyldihydropteridine diphosphokinase